MPKRNGEGIDESNDQKRKKSKISDYFKTGETSEDARVGSDDSDDNEEELGCERLSSSGKSSNWKIVSWNVSGIRAWNKKNGFDAIKKEKAHIICLQETKCSNKDIPQEIKDWSKYPFKYWSPAKKDGYSGVCVLSKVKPIDVKYGIDMKEHDSEGRVITAEFDSFYLVNVYVPNSGRGLKRLDYRMEWDRDFTKYLEELDKKKPLILCGDLNVSHKEIDLENPKTNTKTAGFTPQERENFTKLLSKGFIDSFRELYPDLKKCYTYWSYMRNARQKDIGWRLDYFVISKQITDKLCDNQIRSKVFGSDHCPIVLFIAF